jgi:TolB-like protein/DNA-binding winged helix-turn-helix (wHTH) protein
MDLPMRERGVYVFGPFRLDPARRVLVRNGVVVELTPRLFDTLMYLVEHHDRLVERDELERAVWPDRNVVVSNLGKAISSLRRVLQADGYADNFIVTAPGRGYRFGVPVVLELDPLAAESAAPPAVARDPSAHAPLRAAAPPRNRAALLRLAIWPLAAFALILAVWHGTGGKKLPPAPAAMFAPPPHSVAVLAFTNLSGDPAQAYFSDGLSEELIDSLSRIPSVHVAARLSAFSFKDKPATIEDIAQRLNVGTVLEGSVRRDGQRLRVTAQLVDGVTGYELWSHSYDREESDIFTVQSDLAQAVTASLRVNLGGVDIARLTHGGTSNPQALDAYLRGMAALDASDDSTEAGKRIIAAFDEAVQRDPGFAVAQAQRAMALWHIASTTEHPDLASSQRMKSDALEGAERAVSLAPDLAVSHLALGFALDSALPDFKREEAEFARARALAPGSSDVARYYGRFEVLAGHAEQGVEAAEQAVALDPLTSRTYYLAAWTLYLARHAEEASAALTHAQQLGLPASPYTAVLRGLIALMEDDAATAQRACSGGASWEDDLCLAIADGHLGRQADAMEHLKKLQAKLGASGAYNFADVYAQWGATDDALHWLEAAYALHDPGMIQLRADPLLDPIRHTPRFAQVERKLGFPP